MAIAVVAAAISVGSSVGASAHGMGGHGGIGGFGHSGFGHAGFGPGGFGHGFAFHGDRFRFRHGFLFAGLPYDYGYYGYDDCYARVWTRWRWRSLCY
jgi:hypothetical protein